MRPLVNCVSREKGISLIFAVGYWGKTVKKATIIFGISGEFMHFYGAAAWAVLLCNALRSFCKESDDILLTTISNFDMMKLPMKPGAEIKGGN